MRVLMISRVLLVFSVFFITIASSSFPIGWSEITYITSGPSARVFTASSGQAPLPPPYSPNQNTGMVIFGGTTSGSTFEENFNDVWILNPQNNREGAWLEVDFDTSNPSPSPRCLSAVAVNPQGVLYLYGGFNGSAWFDDFWSLDLVSIIRGGERVAWQNLGVGPSELCGHSLSFIAGKVILFGGGNHYENLFNNVWGWQENTGWQKQAASSPTSPHAREFHAPTVVGDELHIFGGYNYGYYYFNDTWAFEGSTWQAQISNSDAPQGRANAVMNYLGDGEASFLVLYGGRADGVETVFDDTWEYYGGYWAEEGAEGPDGGRFGMGSVLFNGEQHGLVIWGGQDVQGIVYNTTWIYVSPASA